MKLDHLLDRLTCPCCGGTLSRRGSELLCQHGHPFEVHGEVPILLEPEERRQLEQDYGSATQMRGEYRLNMPARARKLVKKLIGSNLRLPTSNRLQEIQDSLGQEWCLEVGSGVKNGTVQRINLDISLFPGVDVVGSGCKLPFADNEIDIVIGVRLLCHLSDWELVLQEMCRVAALAVVFDFPTKRSLNALTPIMFKLKKRIERNTRHYESFWPSAFTKLLAAHGFSAIRRRNQFFLPMVLHRVLGGSVVAKSTERACRLLGLTTCFGSPVIQIALRAD